MSRFVLGNYIEVINLSKYSDSVEINNGDFFRNASRLQKILTPITSKVNISFIGSSNLSYVKIKRLNTKINVSQCSKLLFECVKYMIDNAINTTAINFIVHPDVYAALTGDAEYPFNGGTQGEWEQLCQDAVERNIIFETD